MKFVHYTQMLLEKAELWLCSTTKIHQILLNGEDGLLLEVEIRSQIIHAYSQFLAKLHESLVLAGFVMEQSLVLKQILESSELKVLHESVEKIRTCFEKIRELEPEILKMATELPRKMKNKLLNVQKRKPAMNAYHGGKGIPNGSRFERTK